MTKRKRILAAAIGATVLAASVQGATVYDSFTLVPWTVTRIGIGPIVHEANQRLEVAFPSDAREGASHDYFRGGYQGKCLLRGDFDVQLTYTLLRYPASNGVRAGFDFENKSNVERIRAGRNDVIPGGDYYLIHGDSIIMTPTSDRWGKLRAVRQGGMISGYYFDSTSKTWQFIGSSSFPSEDVHFRVSICSDDYAFGDQFTKVAFDNVVVNSGTLVGAECPLAN